MCMVLVRYIFILWLSQANDSSLIISGYVHVPSKPEPLPVKKYTQPAQNHIQPGRALSSMSTVASTNKVIEYLQYVVFFYQYQNITTWQQIHFIFVNLISYPKVNLFHFPFDKSGIDSRNEFIEKDVQPKIEISFSTLRFEKQKKTNFGRRQRTQLYSIMLFNVLRYVIVLCNFTKQLAYKPIEKCILRSLLRLFTTYRRLCLFQCSLCSPLSLLRLHPRFLPVCPLQNMD